MDYENRIVFPYVEGLLKASLQRISKYPISRQSMSPLCISSTELKDIFLQHYAMPNTRMLNRALFNISACGDDLVSHCEIENLILVPAVEALEKDVYATNRNRQDTAPGKPGIKPQGER